MHLYMIGRLKSICKFKEKQVADTSVTKRASAIVNIKPVQIQRLPLRHLHKQITPWYRYIRYQKSKYIIAPPISITVHLKVRKDYAIQRIGVGLARRSWAGVHSLFWFVVCSELNRNSAEIMKQNHTQKRLIGEKGKIDFQFTNNWKEGAVWNILWNEHKRRMTRHLCNWLKW